MAWCDYLVSYETFLFLAKLNIVLPLRKDMYGWKRDPITAKQEKKLHAMGIGYSRIKYKWHAYLIIRAAEEREKKGLASPRDLKAMYDMGIRDVHMKTQAEADRILGRKPKEEYDGFVVVFRYDDDKKVTACSKEDAHNMCVWMNEHKYKYAYKVL